MKALVFDGNLNLRTDFPKPVPEKDEALIKVILAGICNTDKEIMHGYAHFSGVIGHEFVGFVEECSDPELIGKRVVGDINVGCGECDYCRSGLQNHCLTRKTLGIHTKDGVFADYFTIPTKNLYPLPQEISNENAVFAEPLAAAFNILDSCDIKPEHKVVIIGDGKLGLLIAHALSTATSNLFLIGKHSAKMALVQHIVNPVLLSDAGDLTDCFDFVVDCTGNDSALQMAADLVKAKGTIVLKSTYAGDISVNPSLWVQKEIRLVGSRCGRYEPVLDYLKNNRIDLTNLIEKTYLIDDWEEAFKQAFKKGSLKVLLDFNQK